MPHCQCFICGKHLSGTAWICHACAKVHGLMGRVSTWPQWAKALRMAEQRRRQQETAQCVPVGLDPAAVAEALGNVSSLDNLLPYAPYPTEFENRAYRAANHIPERLVISLPTSSSLLLAA